MIEASPKEMTHKLINSEIEDLLSSWGVDSVLQAQIENQVIKHELDYTNCELRAKFISQTPKFILPDDIIIVQNSQNVMGGYPAGECGDITKSLQFEFDYLDITTQLKDQKVQVLSCCGYEPSLFTEFKKNGISLQPNHVFLALYQSSFKINDPQDIDPKRCIIIDPSMQRITTYPNSGYVIRDIYTGEYQPVNRIIFTASIIKAIRIKEGIVLGLTRDRNFVISFTYAKHGNQIIEVVFLKHKNINYFFHINPKNNSVKTNAIPNEGISIGSYDEAVNIAYTLRNPTLVPVDKTSTYINDDGYDQPTYLDPDGIPLNVSYTKKVNL